MSQSNRRLAVSINVLEALGAGGRRVFRSGELSRTHRERLLSNGCLQEIMKGWLAVTDSDSPQDGSPRWRDLHWEFCARYCGQRFGSEWHLSPEQSLLRHIDSPVLLPRIVIHSPKCANNAVTLRTGVSIYDLKVKAMPSDGSVVDDGGLRLLSIPAALARVPESFFQSFRSEARTILEGQPHSRDIVGHLLSGGHSAIAGRLAGAFRNVGQVQIADDITAAMKAEGFAVRESNPFAPAPDTAVLVGPSEGFAAQLRALWDRGRQSVLTAFPPPSGMAGDPARLLQSIEEQYDVDAFHSLSISGFDVSPELVAYAKSEPHGPASREFLAARGYWQAFQAVKAGVASALNGSPPGEVARRKHGNWYWELIQPGLSAGLIGPDALAGHREGEAEFRISKRMPPVRVSAGDAMAVLFDLLELEESPAARAVLGHFLFASINPYPTCNGRIARFLFNFMLASGGYPWTAFKADQKDAYASTFRKARNNLDFAPLAGFLAAQVGSSIDSANRARATS